jgi:hypothetical protein
MMTPEEKAEQKILEKFDRVMDDFVRGIRGAETAAWQILILMEKHPEEEFVFSYQLKKDLARHDAQITKLREYLGLPRKPDNLKPKLKSDEPRE